MQEEVYIVFEQYLQNEMTVEEKLNFENQIQNDTDLKESFELYKEANQFLKIKFSNETVDFKNNLSLISKQYSSKEANLGKTKVIPINSKWFAIAATIVIFISIWFFMQNGTPEYNDYKEHEKAYFTERSEGNNTLKEAEEAFNAKDYQKAIGFFEKIDQKDFGGEEHLFYAIALIETNQFDKAEVILQLIKEGNSIYKEKAIWYLGLSNLKQKKYDEAKIILETLSDEAEDYDKAQEIIKKL
ncbi:tetratricopeptide repeat protein [Flavobacterium jejuense]|uniref:Tetratricopeptide repeat protein n=1 Tax=Flavobacterium jejuense TaxID=1544455 RepID=A0ABX0IZ44_9FLAO|nr:tetratricopeptide repeat protein [Flavobacterium jejuense]NHN26985.1 tetratricopeptide repeat protein [Flavobacterium jejuense]